MPKKQSNPTPDRIPNDVWDAHQDYLMEEDPKIKEELCLKWEKIKSKYAVDERDGTYSKNSQGRFTLKAPSS